MDISIDIIFLLPEKVVKNSIEISEKNQQFSEKKINLGKEKNIPHLSLWMGIISVSNLEELHQELFILSQKKSLPELTINKISNTNNDLNPIFSFVIEENKALLSWHYEIAKIANRFRVKSEASKHHFAEKNINTSTLNYLNNYNKLHTKENYSAHITLGFGKILEHEYTLHFTPVSIASYQLGNFCCCNRLIKKISF